MKMSNKAVVFTVNNQPLFFDTSSVFEMDFMFRGAAAFNQSLLHFSAEKLENMEYMFAGAGTFDQPETIAHLDTRSPAVKPAAPVDEVPLFLPN